MQAISGNPDDRDSAAYKQTFREPVHESLFQAACENLPWTSVIVVAPFTREQNNPLWLEQLQSTLKLSQMPQAVYLSCEPMAARQRMKQRANPRDAQKLEDWDAMERYYAGPAPAFPHIAVDSSQPGAAQRAIAALLDR